MNWFWFFSPAMSEKWSGEQKRGGNNRVPWLLRLYIACGWKAKNFFSGRTLFSRLLPFCCLVFFQICFFALANNWGKNKKVYPAEKPTFFSHLLPWQSNGGSFPSTILLEKKRNRKLCYAAGSDKPKSKCVVPEVGTWKLFECFCVFEQSDNLVRCEPLVGFFPFSSKNSDCRSHHC